MRATPAETLTSKKPRSTFQSRRTAQINDHITFIYTNDHSQHLLLRDLMENCQTLNVLVNILKPVDFADTQLSIFYLPGHKGLLEPLKAVMGQRQGNTLDQLEENHHWHARLQLRTV